MIESDRSNPSRVWLRYSAILLIALSLVLLALRFRNRKNLIEIENLKEGTDAWRLTRTNIELPDEVSKGGRSRVIEGYCDKSSVRAGEMLRIMVSVNPPSRFRIEIFRTGYYQGKGGRLMRIFDDVEGTTQPEASIGENFVRVCNWTPSVHFEIPDSWLSGVYLGKLTALDSDMQSYVIFVVRDDRPCDLLVQTSELTWAAYNRWPFDDAVYTTRHGSNWTGTGVPSATVSFDRPYALMTHPVNNMPNTVGSGEFLLWEFPLSFWLEQNNYDVSYIANVDTHSDRDGLLRAKGFVSVGHDEYWTRQMYDNVMHARETGVGLAFLCGNAVICQVSLHESSKFRKFRREGWFLPESLRPVPPELLNNPDYEPTVGPDGALLLGSRHPVGDGDAGMGRGSGDFVCTKPNHFVFQGTGMVQGDTIGGAVGWEYHSEFAPDLEVEVVASGPAFINGEETGTHNATVYEGERSNLVFNAGTIWWSQTLSAPPGHVLPSRHGVQPNGPDARAQRITKNVLGRILAKK